MNFHKFIINNKFLRHSSFWWWYRLINHEGFRFDDYGIWNSFWSSLNTGSLDMNYRWEFEKFWGKGAKVETMYVSADDYDALVERLNEPPQYNENLAKLLQRKAPWDDDYEAN